MTKPHHHWKETGFLKHECTVCGVRKERVLGTFRQYQYFHNLTALSKLPECKSTYTCDKIIK